MQHKVTTLEDGVDELRGMLTALLPQGESYPLQRLRNAVDSVCSALPDRDESDSDDMDKLVCLVGNLYIALDELTEFVPD